MKVMLKHILSVLLAATLLAGMCAAGFAQTAAEHVHQYVAETVVEPGYQYGGYTVFRCSCGDSYTEPMSPLTQPYGVMIGGRAFPDDEITVQMRLYCCEGLADLTIDLLYKEYWLQLTGAECAEYGAPQRVTDKALYFASIDPAVHEAVLELTFHVDANAPTGILSVAASGCGASTIPVDEGEEISLTAQSAAINVYRPFQLTVHAPDEPVYAGDTISVTVELAENPGVSGMALDLHYDAQAMQLTDVTANGMFEQGNIMMSGDLSMTPFRILWDDAAGEEPHTESGAILTLTFAVRDTAAAGTTDVWMTFDPDDVLDQQLQPVEMFARGACVTIIRRVPGDVNDDGVTDLRDVTALTRYLAGGWNVTIHERNSDVNADGVFDLKDVVLIRRSLAGGWDITLA